MILVARHLGLRLPPAQRMLNRVNTPIETKPSRLLRFLTAALAQDAECEIRWKWTRLVKPNRLIFVQDSRTPTRCLFISRSLRTNYTCCNQFFDVDTNLRIGKMPRSQREQILMDSHTLARKRDQLRATEELAASWDHSKYAEG